MRDETSLIPTGMVVVSNDASTIEHIECSLCGLRWDFNGNPTEAVERLPLGVLECPDGCHLSEAEASDRCYVLDLHGYTVRDAVRISKLRVREAWENGFRRIRLIHGSALIKSGIDAWYLGRGGIKWELRRRVERGQWSRYVDTDHPELHDIRNAVMTLALRPNPNPLVPARWRIFQSR